jgi:hypothetical protein
MRLELTETIDVSREGVLLRSLEDSDARMSRAWVVFPFDSPDIAAMEPESPARVVRVERDTDGSYRVALQLESPRRSTGSFPAASERRTSPRVALCLPIFVRTDGMPWPEETMTRDFSRTGVKFETSHIYTAGESLHAKIPWGEWAEAGEISGCVARVEAAGHQPTASANEHSGANAAFNAVAVEWTGRSAIAERNPSRRQ